MEQSTFQPGDICLECQQQGLRNRLRTFYIDINEQIVKCESSSCIYPYINDFSDSEEDVSSKEFQKSPPKSTSWPSSDLCSYPNNDFDELDSVRFVEALLCIDGKNNTIEKSGIDGSTTENSATPFPFQTTNCMSPTTSQNHSEMLPLAYSLKHQNTFEPNSFSKDALDMKEDVSCIDKQFSNYKTDASTALHTTSLTTQETSANFDMPEIGFDFAVMPPPPEHRLLDVKKELKPKIEIQCIQTVKAEFTNAKFNVENMVTNESKISISSMEFIKTEYIKEEPVKPADTSENSVTSQANASAGGTRISRYFDALRVKQEKLQKSQSKHSSADRKKRCNGPQQTKSDTANGSSLINVLQVLQTKNKK
ncbi:uncharacterized protein LOC118743341 [Rhagoletis pomonella]|uniref:uncharacterized protein LOC118743341 n=1 Tax=Rhagoletis pomonella TaxID=28610 RepID=UPI00177D9C9F|nr:uncharacterized protein LOC118743341 [Rhagoletis pomonella]